MRGLGRVYVAVSCMVLAALLGGVVFFGMAAWLVPEWTRDVGRETSAALLLLTGLPAPATSGEVRTAVAQEPPDSPAGEGAASSPGGRSAAGSAPRTVSPVTMRAIRGGVGGLESAVREIESDLDALRSGRDPTVAPWVGHRAVAEARLRAWESIRGPLFRLLAALPVEDASRALQAADAFARHAVPGDLPDEELDIRLIAGELATRLSLLEEVVTARRTGVVERLDPHTLVRILLEEDSFSDAEALDILSHFGRVRVVEVIDRLSRLDPERAGRLLRGLAETGAGMGTGGWNEAEAAAVTGGRHDRVRRGS